MSEFVGDSGAFLKFMNSYALFLDDFGESGVYWAKLVESKGGDGLPTTYTLANAHGDGGGHFKIYWCKYKKDRVFTVSLYREANLMFTPKMNGCSFAVGMPATDGNVIVGHANVHDSMDEELKSIDEEMSAKGTSLARIMELNNIRLDMIRARQREMLTGAFAEAEKPGVKKSLDSTNPAYAGASSGIITFGIFDTSTTPNKWRFYFQTKNSGNKVTGIHKIKK
jgi:hypothetical protein